MINGKAGLPASCSVVDGVDGIDTEYVEHALKVIKEDCVRRTFKNQGQLFNSSSRNLNNSTIRTSQNGFSPFA